MHKKEISFSTKMVIACTVAWAAYFVVFVIYKFNNPSGTWDATLTTAWFAGWGGELVMLASIKKDRIKNTFEKEEK